uniref:Uncharacterized protein n=2 Tax=Brassica campestris TaxID=3711 RepID=M4CFD1_BRACM
MESGVDDNCVRDGRGGAGLGFPEISQVWSKVCQSDGMTESSGKNSKTKLLHFMLLLQLAGSRFQDWKFFQVQVINVFGKYDIISFGEGRTGNDAKEVLVHQMASLFAKDSKFVVALAAATGS